MTVSGLLLVLILGTAGFAILQAALVIGFARQREVGRPVPAKVNEESRTWPEVRVVLCVRGADPSLPACLQSLLHLDYPNYRLVVVADSADDPAWRVVDRLGVSLSHRLDRLVLGDGERLDSCSLKCSSLIRACRDLPESVEIVALVDADTLPSPNWLKMLVEPFEREAKIGVTTGVRWYSPVDRGLASRVRAVWNAAAIVQMWAYSIPWGGSMAVRRRVLDEAGLLQRWTETFCEDTPTTSTIRPYGWKVATIRALVLDNHEACRWKDLVPWISRQLLTARLHHPAWPLVASHGVLSFALPVGLALASLVSMLSGLWREAAGAGVVLVAYELAMAGLVALIGRSLLSQKRGDEPMSQEALPSPGYFAGVDAVLVSQLVHPWALWRAIASRRVVWRQIPYRMLRRGRIQRDGYEPYVPAATTSAESL